MDIAAFYLDERNAITQPDKIVFMSQYFRRNWMGQIGPTGTAIVLYLRGACYHNRKSGETRDTVQLSQREIAQGCGCSVATIKRELEHNEALRRFIQVSHEWERNGSNGRVRQLENIYQVAMDDPLTEQDKARLRQMVDERITREKGRQGSDAGMKEPLKAIRLAAPLVCIDALLQNGINAVNTASSNAVKNNTTQSRGRKGRSAKEPVAQSELLRPGGQIELTPVQNELPIEESLLQTTRSKTLNVEKTINFVDSHECSEDEARPAYSQSPRNVRGTILDNLTASLVNELKDFGSERRHRQLLDICERNGLDELAKQALLATRRRLAQEQEQGVLEKPGAYYQKILIGLLEDHQVFVPPAGSKDEQANVRRLIQESMTAD